MDKNDFVRMGQEMKDSIEKTVESIPYEEIGKKVSQGVEEAGERFREGYKKAQKKNRKPDRKKNQGEVQNTQAAVFSKKPKGRISWFFFLFFGVFICICAGAVILADLLTSLIYGMDIILLTSRHILSVLFLGAGCYLALKGRGTRKRIHRFRIYQRHLEGKEYCQLSVLEKTTGRSVRFLRWDLKKMLSLGMFPQGHLDEQGTCLMLTERAYDQYLLMVESQVKKKQEEDEEKKRKEQEAEQKKPKEQQPRYFTGTKEERESQIEQLEKEKEIARIVEEGEGYLAHFDTINDRLAGEVITRKLSRLSLVTGRIFKFITEHPEKVGEIKKFMSYYLPTTEKLLNTYEQLDTELVQGENILKAKKEIEDTLDTINFAFENLLDSLYEDTIMDISTDITVLETMLAQEGLTDQEF
ncbi:MAG: 5-bromo-4-chloroindolyl phosphate hydrolysis family protein [Lachnospiraceae bacterium]|nr:5-bromo-4-chloroindolyl phosphate hydrolysis family protein [Lachnospiraceae bacterium]